MKPWKIAGINFDHFHMGDLLREVHEHPCAEIVGICDESPDRMVTAKENFGLSDEQVFTDVAACLEKTKPDVAILCPAAARHAEWVEKVAPFGVHILMEKPFAASLKEADQMITAMKGTGKELVINWPMRWYAGHATAYRLIREGIIGEIIEVHYYDGNRGPLYHGADKIEKEPTAEEKDASWFYKQAEGGGSLLDYLGYGTTLGTWFHDGRKPVDVTCMTDEPAGLEVDEHSITVARYDCGLSKFETRWGTFTDPWTLQPQPKCGFVLKGTEGTLSSYDAESSVRVQTRDCPEGREIPNDEFPPHEAAAIPWLLHRLENDLPIDGPLSVETSRIGQQIVDTAIASAREKRTVKLLG
ncbi:MAG: Gfo/Idh/MocA family oxidoreductase [Verrucomicrobiota bacterium]